MRVVILITGAGGMYCGSCIRDNRLAATLRAMGRDVSLLPLYTPIRTDEQDVSEPTIHYGGINVYLQQKSAVFRHTPGFVDRMLDSPALLRGVGRLAVNTKAENLGGMTVSVLKGAAGAQRKELRKLIEALRAIEPDVVHLPNLMMIGMAGPLREALQVPIVCSLSGEDIFLDALPEPDRSEAFGLIRGAAGAVDVFTAPTRYYASHCIEHFGLPHDRVVTIPVGIRVEDFYDAARAQRDGPFTIGYLARICPEKGLHVLVDALVRLRRAGHDCRVRAAGYLGGGDRAYFEEVRNRLMADGVAESFEYLGEVSRDAKIAHLQSIDVFSVPTVYHEAKGLFVLEALAAGAPVVLPAHGAFPELVAETGGGLVYDPAEPDALANALIDLMRDRDKRTQLGRNAREGVRAKFTDIVMATQTWELYERIAGKRGR